MKRKIGRMLGGAATLLLLICPMTVSAQAEGPTASVSGVSTELLLGMLALSLIFLGAAACRRAK